MKRGLLLTLRWRWSLSMLLLLLTCWYVLWRSLLLSHRKLWHLSVCFDVMLSLLGKTCNVTIPVSIESKCSLFSFTFSPLSLLSLSYPLKALHIWWQNKVCLSLPLLSHVFVLHVFLVCSCMVWCSISMEMHGSIYSTLWYRMWFYFFAVLP